MSVIVGDVDAFMSHPVSDCRGRKAHVDEKRNCAVPDVMNPNTLHPRLLCASVHFPMEIAFCNGKHSVIFAHIVEHFQIVLNFLYQKLRHFDNTIAFLRLWRGDDILLIEPLVRFIDGYRTFFKIEVCRSERQQRIRWL